MGFTFTIGITGFNVINHSINVFLRATSAPKGRFVVLFLARRVRIVSNIKDPRAPKFPRIIDTLCFVLCGIAEKFIMELPIENPPLNWNDDPAPAKTASLGEQRVKSNTCAALSLPSVIFSRERFFINCVPPCFYRNT